jgi:HAMP domain-containing protein
MRPNWIKVIAALAVLWVVVYATTSWVRRSRPTPENIAAFVATNSLDGKPAAERAKLIEAVASKVNRLEYDQRRELNEQRKIEAFWNGLNAEEKSRYLDLVLPTGFKQMMENFNKMEPGKRRRMVQKAVENLRSEAGDRPPRDLNDPQLRKIVDQGLKSFYSDATIDAKMDALPFLEALEQTVKWAH